MRQLLDATLFKKEEILQGYEVLKNSILAINEEKTYITNIITQLEEMIEEKKKELTSLDSLIRGINEVDIDIGYIEGVKDPLNLTQDDFFTYIKYVNLAHEKMESVNLPQNVALRTTKRRLTEEERRELVKKRLPEVVATGLTNKTQIMKALGLSSAYSRLLDSISIELQEEGIIDYEKQGTAFVYTLKEPVETGVVYLEKKEIPESENEKDNTALEDLLRESEDIKPENDYTNNLNLENGEMPEPIDIENEGIKPGIKVVCIQLDGSEDYHLGTKVAHERYLQAFEKCKPEKRPQLNKLFQGILDADQSKLPSEQLEPFYNIVNPLLSRRRR